MSYTKTEWVNNSSPYLNADNLNHIENGIEANDTAIGELNSLDTTAKSNIVSAINEVVTNLDSLPKILAGEDYLKIGTIGVCWGQAHPNYANANVLQGSVQLPISFSHGRCVASPVNYGNIEGELDAIAKVPSDVTGNGITLALHSNAGKFTTGSTAFYINYIIVGTLSS